MLREIEYDYFEVVDQIFNHNALERRIENNWYKFGSESMRSFMLVVWLVRFHSISTCAGYLTLNPFLCEQSVLFQTIQFSQAVLILLIQVSISADFVYTQLKDKTVLC